MNSGPLLVLAFFALSSPLFAEEAIDHGEESIDHEETIDHGEEAIDHGEEEYSHGEKKEKKHIHPVDAFEIEADMIGHYSSLLQMDRRFDREREDIVEWTQRLDLGIDLRPSPKWHFFLSGELMHWTGGKKNQELVNLYINPQDVRTAFSANLGIALANYQDGHWDLTIGNLITRWGSSDISRPLDIINPIDRTQAMSNEALVRIPQFTLDAKYNVSDFSAQFILVPFFVPDRSFLFGRDSSLLSAEIPAISSIGLSRAVQNVDPSIEEFVQPALVASERPDEDPSNISIGTRLRMTLLNTDLSLSYFFGWDRTPNVEVDADVRRIGELVFTDEAFLENFNLVQFLGRNKEASEALKSIQKKAQEGKTFIASSFSRLHTLGIDGVRYFGPFGLRIDLALHPAKTFISQSLGTVRRPYMNGVIALSYENIESEDDAFTLLLEAFYAEAASGDASLGTFFVPKETRGVGESLLFGNRSYGLMTSIVWQLAWLPLQAQAAMRYDVEVEDLFFSGSLRYAWTPRFKTSLGLTLFESFGEKMSILKALDHNDFFWIKVEGVY